MIVEGVMVSSDGAWRVEAVRAGTARWYRLIHGDSTVEGLALATLVRILADAGVSLADLDEAGPAA